ncbi:MAG: YdcF family protein [Chloroflexi bacterium]|nr:YdcF family protein [Chloroflexota bacterium]
MGAAIPNHPDHANLSADVVDEITSIVFGPVVELQPCDVIFIFGGLAPGLWEKGAEAYQRGLGKDVVVTGGYKPGASTQYWVDGIREAHIICRELIKRGVPEAVISYEDRSTNTLENVLFAMEVYDFSTVTRVLAVCKCYGVGRQCRTLKWHLDRGVQVIPYPFDARVRGKGPVITSYNWMDYEDSRSYMLEQVTKMVDYGGRGHLEPVEHMSGALTEIVRKRLRV